MADSISRRDALKAGAVTVIAAVTTRVYRARQTKPVCTVLPVISHQRPEVGVPVTVTRGTWA